MPSRSLGFEEGDILLVPLKGEERIVDVKKILPNFDVTYANLVSPRPGEDKKVQFYSGHGFKILHRIGPACYKGYGRYPAQLWRYCARPLGLGAGADYIELVELNPYPLDHKPFVVNYVTTDGGGFEEYDTLPDALASWKRCERGTATQPWDTDHLTKTDRWFLEYAK